MQGAGTLPSPPSSSMRHASPIPDDAMMVAKSSGFFSNYLPRGKDHNTVLEIHASYRCGSALQSTRDLTLQHGWRMTRRVSLVPRIRNRYQVVRGATTEDVEAEKELIEEDALERMEKTLESVKGNFNTVRTGRASPALLDRIEVEYYGSPVTLKSIAQVSTPDGNSLLIQPFDKSSLSSIEKAISKSDIGLTPSNDGNSIRLFIPPLTAERRKDLLKMVSKLSEEGKIAIRNIRRDAIKSYEKLEKEKKLSTDNVKDLSTSMQKLTDDYVKKVEAMFKQKEKELMTV